MLYLTEFLFYQVLIAQLSCNQLHKTATTDCLLQMCSILSSSLSHGVLSGPLPCTLVVLVRVCLVQPMTKPEWNTDWIHQWRPKHANNLAISGTRGSSGLGSQRREQIDKRTWKDELWFCLSRGQFNSNGAPLIQWVLGTTGTVGCRGIWHHYCG